MCSVVVTSTSTAPPNFNHRCGWAAEHPPKKPEPDALFGKTNIQKIIPNFDEGGEDLDTDPTVKALLSAAPASNYNRESNDYMKDRDSNTDGNFTRFSPAVNSKPVPTGG